MRWTAAALLGVIIGAACAQSAMGLTSQERRGAALVAKFCGACHAVGRTGHSAHAGAPPLRTLGERYRIEALEEALAEGLLVGHPEMPEVRFQAREVGDVIAYLKAIQSR
jgi:cytochrome c